MRTLKSSRDIAEALISLVAAEPRFAAVVERHGQPSLRHMEAGLPGLLRIVVDQLISLKAGAAIWRRIEAELAPFDPHVIRRKREATLMQLGLSGAKARAFKAIATAIATGGLDFTQLETQTDAEALKTLTAIKGIGPWTADIYLLWAMGRADAWPVGDLALQVGTQHLLGLESRPEPKHLANLAEPWRPHRAVAARLLWSHYRGLKGMTQASG